MPYLFCLPDLIFSTLSRGGGHLKGYNYLVPHTAPENLVAKFQATVTAIDANVLRCVTQNARRRTVFCTEMGPGCFKYLL